MEQPAAAKPPGMAISARELSKRYGRRQAVSGLTFTVESGQICALLGPNGAGKTSTMRMLVGLSRADSGSGTGARHDAVCQVPPKPGEGGRYGSRSLLAAPKFDPRSQPRDCPGCKKQAMFRPRHRAPAVRSGPHRGRVP